MKKFYFVNEENFSKNLKKKREGDYRKNLTDNVFTIFYRIQMAQFVRRERYAGKDSKVF